MLPFQKHRTPGFFALLSLPSTAMGFALSVQISALSWILTTQYGLDIYDVGLVWAAGPLAGIIGQVFIGIISDRVWFWGGRRRPFILIGGTIAALMLLALPHIDVISDSLGLGGILGVAIAVALILDLAINVSFNPTRSLIADVTGEGDERTRGYTWMQTISGTFGVLAYAIGAIWNNYVLIYFGAVLVLVFSLLPTLFITEPRKLADEDEERNGGAHGNASTSIGAMLLAIRPLWGFLVYDVYAMGRRMLGIEPEGYTAEILCAMVTLGLVLQAVLEKAAPHTPKANQVAFRRIVAAHSLSWIGIQTTFVFLFAYLQFALPDMSDIDMGRVGSLAFLVLNAVGALLPAFALEPLARRYGRVQTHTAALACMTVGYLALWQFAGSPAAIFLLMAVVGIGWGAMVSLPFAIVSQRVRQQEMGLFMGLFNLSVVLPQLVVSLGIALVISRAPDKSLIFLISAVALGLATLAWSQIRDD
ncbi:MAG: MFS transporter [Xanthomonadales bacterium]|jgi:MFS family permease|nr:MFS transporter [Xanthomonadales bacterium]